MSEGSDRLARSRMAILEQIERKERRHERVHSGPQQGHAAEGRVGHLLDMLRQWWRRHPVSMAVDFVSPSLGMYARRRPAKFLGVAAGVGALLFFARPWKLISLTGLVIALVKTSQLSGLVSSAMSAAGGQDDEPARR